MKPQKNVFHQKNEMIVYKIENRSGWTRSLAVEYFETYFENEIFHQKFARMHEME